MLGVSVGSSIESTSEHSELGEELPTKPPVYPELRGVVNAAGYWSLVGATPTVRLAGVPESLWLVSCRISMTCPWTRETSGPEASRSDSRPTHSIVLVVFGADGVGLVKNEGQDAPETLDGKQNKNK